MRVLLKTTVFLLALVCLTLPQQVLALELTVTSNGDSSSSEVDVTSQNTTQVNQVNNTNVENNVDAKANSGGNKVNSSNGGSNIQTGDSKSETTVANEVGKSQVESNQCCSSQEDSAKIENNGSGSTNNISVNTTVTQNFTSSNSATVINNIKATSSTGGNSISHVVGNASIVTGNATIKINVENVLNVNQIIDPAMGSGSTRVKIEGNSSSSLNNINSQQNKNTTFSSNNTANVLNNLIVDADTGSNTISSTHGQISLLTGKSSILVNISNKINKNVTIASACCGNHEEGNPPEENKDTPPARGGYSSSPQNNSTPGGSGGVGGVDVLGMSTGSVLPATGGGSLSLWATIFNVFMLLFGLYLRRTAGRSPTK